MPTFNEFQWATFFYWICSYGGNIGGDIDYVPLMRNAQFLERLRTHPETIETKEIKDKLIYFLNKWKCRLSTDDSVGEEIVKVLVQHKAKLSNLKNLLLLDMPNSTPSLRDSIISIFDDFDQIQHFGPTAISKTMHILCPDLFIMGWTAPL